MRLALGTHAFDVSRRAVIVGQLPPVGVVDALLRRGDELVAEGADALDLGWVGPPGELGVGLAMLAAVAARLDVPLVAPPVPAVLLPDVVGAGASVVTGVARPDELAVAAELGVSVVLAPGAQPSSALAAGIDPEQLMLDAGVETGATELEQRQLLRDTGPLAAEGLAVLLTVAPGLPAVAACAMGISLGCRVVRTTEVRSARRTADLLAEILAARDGGGR